jgi:hypothetical protein
MRPDRSVIHQNINGAKMRNTGFCNSFCFGLIANIAHHNKRCDAMRAHLISDRFSGVTIAAAIDDDIESGCRQMMRDTPANILSGAGDEDCFSIGLHGYSLMGVTNHDLCRLPP